jgi:hypothetical protein
VVSGRLLGGPVSRSVPQRRRTPSPFSEAPQRGCNPPGQSIHLANGQPFSEAALVDAAGVLHVGCYPCLDGAVSLYRIVAASPSGLWGLWEPPINENLMRLSDTRTGRDLPYPAGLFCALRRSLDSSRTGHSGA